MSEVMGDPHVCTRRWLVGDFERAPGQTRIVCFPHAGAGASSMLPWRELMPPGVEWFVARLPGRESRTRESAFVEFPALMDGLIGALAPFLAPPYALFGHSMGALIAFELARRLAEMGLSEPVALFVSGSAPPELHEAEWRDWTPDDSNLERLLRELGGTPDAVIADGALLDLVLPVLRADLALCAAYRFVPGRILSCPIVALGGEGDDSAPPDSLEGWSRHTRGSFRRAIFAGGHFYLDANRHQVVDELARELDGGPSRW